LIYNSSLIERKWLWLIEGKNAIRLFGLVKYKRAEREGALCCSDDVVVCAGLGKAKLASEGFQRQHWVQLAFPGGAATEKRRYWLMRTLVRPMNPGGISVGQTKFGEGLYSIVGVRR
jgi:hypothetical protein